MSRLRWMFVALALATLGLGVGCGSSTDPIESPLFFSGEIGFQGSEFHNFMVVKTGTVRVEMTRLQQKVAEGEEPLGVDLTIGMGVGRPAGDQCSTRSSLPVQEGGVIVLGLSSAEYCVRVFDGGTLFDGFIAEYTVSVSPG